jgi:hypothetical protein
MSAGGFTPVRAPGVAQRRRKTSAAGSTPVARMSDAGSTVARKTRAARTPIDDPQIRGVALGAPHAYHFASGSRQ